MNQEFRNYLELQQIPMNLIDDGTPTARAFREAGYPDSPALRSWAKWKKRKKHKETSNMDKRLIDFERHAYMNVDVDAIPDLQWSELHDLRSKVKKVVGAIAEKAGREARDYSPSEERAIDFAGELIDAVNREFETRDAYGCKCPIDQRDKTIVNPLPDEARITTPNGNTRVARPGRETRCDQIRGYKARPNEMDPADFLGQLFSQRLTPELDAMRIEKRGTIMGVGPLGGYAVPDSLKVQIVNRMLESAGLFSKIRKEFVENAGSLTVASLDNTNYDTDGLSGFSRAGVIGEGVTFPEGENKWVSSTWDLRKMGTSTKISVEAVAGGGDQLVNAVSDALAQSLLWGIEYAMVQGDLPHISGLIGDPATLEVNRAAANQISFTDCVNMVAATRPSTGSFWLANQTTIKQLAAMTDAGGHAVWVGNGVFDGAKGGIPSTLMGFPILFNLGVSPKLGSTGDIMFISDPADWYKWVAFQDIVIETSNAVYWTTGFIAMRAYMLMDCGALPGNTITIGGENYGFCTALKA